MFEVSLKLARVVLETVGTGGTEVELELVSVELLFWPARGRDRAGKAFPSNPLANRTEAMRTRPITMARAFERPEARLPPCVSE